MSWRNRVLPLAVTLSVTSCADSLAPSATNERSVEPGVALLGKPTGEVVSFSELNLLSHNLPLETGDGVPLATLAPNAAPDAPSLDRYEVSFWAVKGEKSRVTIYYATDDDDDDDDKERFLRFKIPRDGLAFRPDGTTIEEGDSVLITLQIHASSVIASFSPAGLVFNEDAPGKLKIWYGRLLDPDNEDGDDDDDDDDEDGYEVVSPDFWFRQNGADAWDRLYSKHNTKNRWIKTHVYHFSDYAVSW